MLKESGIKYTIFLVLQIDTSGFGDASKITSFENVCLSFNISIDANSVDPDQTNLGLHCLIKRLQNLSAGNKNIRLFVICALKVNTYEVSVYTTRTFMKCTHVCAAQTTF